MAGSRLPIAVAHGEGRAEFRDRRGSRTGPRPLVALRYVDTGAGDRAYPRQSQRLPRGIAGLTSTDGRVTILMPHPERVFRTLQYSWHPEAWGEDGPWLRLFRNARRWVARGP
jgi:phosphoribosylformylglycinamidine synthase